MNARGALLGGGTRFIAAWRDGEEEQRLVVPTGDPATVIEKLAAFFAAHPVAGLGVAMFGPIELSGDKRGTLLATPKPGWTGTNILEELAASIERQGAEAPPMGLETDVGGAALAEHAVRGSGADLVYVTVGTGIGAGAVVNGKVLRGARHPEMGHVAAPRSDPFAGVCPFHGACIEGVASGPAISARTGRPSQELEDDDPVWTHVAAALGRLTADIALILCPNVVVLGGGVIEARPFLRKLARHSMREKLGRYGVSEPSIEAPVHERPGLEGAFVLARDLSAQSSR